MSPRAGVAAAIVLAGAGLAAQRPLFVDSRKSPTPLDIVDSPRSFVADLDGDGIADVVRTVCGGALALWRGVGGGRFEAVAGSPNRLFALADLDGDGDLDLVGDGTLHRNDRGWRFTPLAGPWLRAPVAAADLDGDGRVDLVDGFGRLFLGTAPFAFQAAGRLSGDTLRAIVVADLDRDGNRDLVGVVDGPGVRLLLNNGAAQFTDFSATHLPAGATDWVDAAAADVDGDGDLDLVVARGAAGAGLFANDGRARFTDQSARLRVQALHVQAVAAGDLDGDGDVDLVLGTREHGGVLLDNRGTSFLQLPPARWPSPRQPISALTLADADGDGDLDVFTAGTGLWHCGAQGVETDVAFNHAGTLQPGRPAALDVPVAHGHAAAGDLDGDGTIDALVTEGAGALLRGDGRGGFAAPIALNLAVEGRPTLGDLDGDGDLDAVLAGGGVLTILRNPGNGLLVFSHVDPLPLPVWAVVSAVALADLEGDGDLDAALATSTQQFWVGYAPDLVCWNDGRGRFTAAPDVLPSPAVDSFDIRAADLDGDGDLDLAAGSGIYLNLRPGKFDRVPVWLGGQLALADLDADGRIDIVSATGCSPCHMCIGPGPGVVHWNEGGGRFTEQTLETRGIACAVAALDADGDGDLDLVFGHIDGLPHAMAPNVLMANLGGRRFARDPTGIPEDWDDTRALAAADLDHDGDPDLVLFNAFRGFPSAVRSRVYLNTTRQLVALDPAAPARPYRLRIHGGARGAVLLLAAQGGRLDTPFGRLGLDLRTTVTFGAYGPPPPGATIDVDVVLPPDPGLVGSALWWQALVGDGSALGGRLTNTVREIVTRS